MKSYRRTRVDEQISQVAVGGRGSLHWGLVTSLFLLLAVFTVVVPAQAETTVYVTADNLNGTNLFGTLNLRTGRFTEIAQTTPLIYALTSGPGDRLYGADINTGTLFTISRSGALTPYGTITAPGYYAAPYYGFLGLVREGWGDDFLAVNVDPVHVSLYSLTNHGRKLTDRGIIEGPNTGVYFSGSLTAGPFGKLYFDFIPPSGPQLYTIDPRNGAPTPVGEGLGTDVLALFSDATNLYGIDADATKDIGIYVIDRKSGRAVPTGVKIKGLPGTDDFYIDSATVANVEEGRCE